MVCRLYSIQSEKQVAAQLRKKNVEVYLPLISRTKRYMRKLKTYQIPLCWAAMFCKNQSKPGYQSIGNGEW